MSTTEKGNKLEDIFYNYLRDQQDRGELVNNAHPPELCKIFKKKKYFCPRTNKEVEFDVVIELYRENQEKPQIFIVFECKNHKGRIPTIYVNEFISRLDNVFSRAAKGVFVISSSLQSGAFNLATNSNLGIIKYDEFGIEFIAERRAAYFPETSHIKSLLIDDDTKVKPLKFSALYKKSLYGSLSTFLESLLLKNNIDADTKKANKYNKVPYLPKSRIKQISGAVLNNIDYKKGQVDLRQVCLSQSINLQLAGETVQDQNGEYILGTANFENRTIQINRDVNTFRKRFTLAHEIGHFCLNHDQFLRTDTILENDLFSIQSSLANSDYARLEIQANSFASEILLPEFVFRRATHVAKLYHDVRGNASADIYVDNQRSNYVPYNALLQQLSEYFCASKMAIEIRFKQLGMIDDRRDFKNPSDSYDTIISAFSKIWDS